MCTRLLHSHFATGNRRFRNGVAFEYQSNRSLRVLALRVLKETTLNGRVGSVNCERPNLSAKTEDKHTAM